MPDFDRPEQQHPPLGQGSSTHRLTGDHRAWCLAPDAYDWAPLAATRTTEASVDALTALPYPRFYLSMPTEPGRIGEPLPWSCLAEAAWNELTQSQSRCVSGADSHRESAQSLLAALAYRPVSRHRLFMENPSYRSEAGPVFVWNGQAVQTVLSDWAVALPDLAPHLQRIAHRLVALQPLTPWSFQSQRVRGREGMQPSPVCLLRLTWLLAGEHLCTWLGDLPESLQRHQPEDLLRACVVLREAAEGTHPSLIRNPVSLLQRRLTWGYARALSLVEPLQALGVLSPVLRIPWEEV